MLMLMLVAVISLILGMGLPTTANYIVVSTLMAPVIVELGAQSGLLVPLIAVHLFVFYFGLMADVTPPVGLASFAAAAIARTDPIKTGVTAFYYSMRTAILPFLFIFNTQLLLIGIDSAGQLALTVASAVVAMLLFAAATQGYFLVRTRWYETIALLLIAFTLFRPGFWLDGKEVRKGVLLPLGDAGPARERLRKIGLTVMALGSEVQVAAVQFGSPAEKLGLEQGFKVVSIEMPADRPAKEWMFLPALALLALVVLTQRAAGQGRPGCSPPPPPAGAGRWLPVAWPGPRGAEWCRSRSPASRWPCRPGSSTSPPRSTGWTSAWRVSRGCRW
jgi:hypothetical protein